MKAKGVVHWGLICWLTYLSAYLCRVNFSASLTSLSAQLGVDYSLLGTAGAAFFVVYAAGQLVNGFLGDHVNPVRFILTAIFGTVLCNVGVAYAGSFPAIFVLWALNGYFQSIFWSTMIRVLALVTSKGRQGSASASISSAMPAGYLISWCVLAPSFANAHVRWFFLAPVLITLPMALLWWGREKDLPSMPVKQLKPGKLRDDIRNLLRLVRSEHLVLILAACVFHGLIKEGIAFWIPTIIRHETSSAGYTAMALALLPAANLAGTLAAKKLLGRFGQKPYRIVAGCFAVMLPLCAATGFCAGVWVLAPMCLISMMSYCANTVLLSFIPMQYQARGFVASLVGLLDFCSYMGAAVSTYALGGMMNASGVQGVAPVWLTAAAAAIILLIVGGKHNEKRTRAGAVSNPAKCD
ncbi:MAG: MFS transporter [Clostridia bacterium]|nr:MFS transporter [Clostridia bacterium]